MRRVETSREAVARRILSRAARIDRGERQGGVPRRLPIEHPSP
jgi:hypothetical protein